MQTTVSTPSERRAPPAKPAPHNRPQLQPPRLPCPCLSPIRWLPRPLRASQNTALATLETNVLVLRRSPLSSAAPEPIAMVRRRCTLGAPASVSSVVTSVPRSSGTWELLAYVNWCAAASVS
jgi:hypothetical protein